MYINRCDICGIEEHYGSYGGAGGIFETLQSWSKTSRAFPGIQAQIDKRSMSICRSCFGKLAQKIDEVLTDMDARVMSVMNENLRMPAKIFDANGQEVGKSVLYNLEQVEAAEKTIRKKVKEKEVRAAVAEATKSVEDEIILKDEELSKN